MQRLILIATLALTASAANIPNLLRTARAASQNGDVAGAAAAYDQALEAAMGKPDPSLPQVAIELANFYNAAHQPDQAEMVLKRALEREDSASISRQRNVTGLLIAMKDQLIRERRRPEAEPYQGRLVQAWTEQAGPESVVVANTLVQLALLQQQSGPERAKESLQRALPILMKNYGPDAPSVGYVHMQLAIVEKKLGENELAAAAANRAVAIDRNFIAAGTPKGAVQRIGGDVTAPVAIQRTEPQYSELARKSKIQGAVVVSLVVGTDGLPEDVRLLIPLGAGLDENAVATVLNWRFRPGTKDGQPVPVKATIEINFRLL